MRIKLIKRSVVDADGPGFGKAEYLYEVVNHREMKVCEAFVYRVLGIDTKPGDIIEVDVITVQPNARVGMANWTDEQLIAELSSRLDRRS